MGYSDVHFVWLLGAGHHVHPHKGGCLLELVSTLPGGPWSDRPDSVDPVLRVLTWSVNDRTSPAERPALAPLIPWLATMASVSERKARAAVVTTVVAAVRPYAEPDVVERLSLDAVAACAEVDASGLRSWRAHYVQRRAAARAVRLAVATLARHGGDAALRTLLVEVINELRMLNALPAIPPLMRPAEACRVAVPIHSKILSPEGGESIYTHCNALVEDWPGWLQEPWVEAASVAGVSARPRSSTEPLSRSVEP